VRRKKKITSTASRPPKTRWNCTSCTGMLDERRRVVGDRHRVALRQAALDLGDGLLDGPGQRRRRWCPTVGVRAATPRAHRSGARSTARPSCRPRRCRGHGRRWGPDARCATRMSAKSAGRWMRPRVRTTNSVLGISMRPPGTSRFSVCSARVTRRPTGRRRRGGRRSSRRDLTLPAADDFDRADADTRSRRSLTTSFAKSVISRTGTAPARQARRWARRRGPASG